jgi:hypothetical protein
MTDGYTLGSVTLTMPGAGVGDNSLFSSRSPKGDAIKAVKLTKANAHEVSKHIAEEVKVDIVEVDLDHEVLRCSTKSRGSVLSASFGSWIVEGYDYGNERATFRLARADEREKYDLR